MFRKPSLIALVLISLLLLAAPLRADDGEAVPEDSAAARLFRDAWWAETGAGALDKALVGYRKAAAAQGSDEIHARARYREALVLQRMGRTEDAVHALERLTKAYPGNEALLAKAKQRLDAWQPEDLRANFSDWYRRYRYGAAFQGKIVDLILKLGSLDGNVSGAASQELLTIGEPALPALRENVTSPNARLRSAAVGLLIDMGVLPTPAALMGAVGWERMRGFWKLLLAAPEETKTAYREALGASSGDTRAAWILAALQPPDALPDAVADVVVKERDRGMTLRQVYIPALLDAATAPGFFARVRRLVVDAGVSGRMRSELARMLIQRWESARRSKRKDATGLSVAEVLTWLHSDELEVRKVVYGVMARAGLPSPDAWRAVADIVRRGDPTPNLMQEGSAALIALLGQLRLAPAEGGLEGAVDALAGWMSRASVFGYERDQALKAGPEMPGDGVVPRRVLAEALLRARGRSAMRLVGRWWTELGALTGLDPLLSMARDAADVGVRTAAMENVALRIRADVGRLTALLVEPTERALLADALFKGLRNNAGLVGLDWDLESLTRLAEAAALDRGRGMVGSSAATFQQCFEDARLRALFFEAALAAPERFSYRLWQNLPKGWSEDPKNRSSLLAGIAAHWPAWTPAQRGVGLNLFLSSNLLGNSFQIQGAAPFLRKVLAAGDLAFKDRYRAIEVLKQGRLTLEDLRRAYDFTKEDELRRASWYLQHLPRTAEVYDAFIGLLRRDPAGPGRGQTTVGKLLEQHFRSGPESRAQDLIQRLLASPAGMNHSAALDMLRRRNDLGDMPLWIKALGSKDAGTRRTAALMMGTLYDEAAIKALAAAVDDENPAVRDAVLAALERIEKTEKQKEHWRAFARAHGK